MASLNVRLEFTAPAWDKRSDRLVSAGHISVDRRRLVEKSALNIPDWRSDEEEDIQLPLLDGIHIAEYMHRIYREYSDGMMLSLSTGDRCSHFHDRFSTLYSRILAMQSL